MSDLPTAADSLDEILVNMVENTMMILTNDLPSLLDQDNTYKIRRHHKDDILRNLPEARAAIDAYLDHRLDAAVARINGLKIRPMAHGYIKGAEGYNSALDAAKQSILSQKSGNGAGKAGGE